MQLAEPAVDAAGHNQRLSQTRSCPQNQEDTCHANLSA
jgi:hypothetical protein